MSHVSKPALGTVHSAQQVSASRLRAHVERLAGEIGERNVFRPEALRAAEHYIQEEWRSQGYQVTPHWYEVSGGQWANLEVTRLGSARSHEILLIGAHYDSVRGSPGANDNASGVSALLELSRLFAELIPAVTVRFVAFVNEEPPFFFRRKHGSEAYAKAAQRAAMRSARWFRWRPSVITGTNPAASATRPCSSSSIRAKGTSSPSSPTFAPAP